MVRIANKERSPEQEFHDKVDAYLQLKASVTDLTKQMNVMKNELASIVDESGEADESGSLWINLPEEMHGVAALKRERRVSYGVDEERAEEILRERKLHKRCFKKVRVIDQDEVMACVAEELITPEELEEMFPPKITWATVTPKSGL